MAYWAKKVLCVNDDKIRHILYRKYCLHIVFHMCKHV